MAEKPQDFRKGDCRKIVEDALKTAFAGEAKKRQLLGVHVSPVLIPKDAGATLADKMNIPQACRKSATPGIFLEVDRKLTQDGGSDIEAIEKKAAALLVEAFSTSKESDHSKKKGGGGPKKEKATVMRQESRASLISVFSTLKSNEEKVLRLVAEHFPLDTVRAKNGDGIEAVFVKKVETAAASDEETTAAASNEEAKKTTFTEEIHAVSWNLSEGWETLIRAVLLIFREPWRFSNNELLVDLTPVLKDLSEYIGQAGIKVDEPTPLTPEGNAGETKQKPKPKPLNVLKGKAGGKGDGSSFVAQLAQTAQARREENEVSQAADVGDKDDPELGEPTSTTGGGSGGTSTNASASSGEDSPMKDIIKEDPEVGNNVSELEKNLLEVFQKTAHPEDRHQQLKDETTTQSRTQSRRVISEVAAGVLHTEQVIEVKAALKLWVGLGESGTKVWDTYHSASDALHKKRAALKRIDNVVKSILSQEEEDRAVLEEESAADGKKKDHMEMNSSNSSETCKSDVDMLTTAGRTISSPVEQPLRNFLRTVLPNIMLTMNLMNAGRSNERSDAAQFEDLVRMTQTRTHLEKRREFEKLPTPIHNPVDVGLTVVQDKEALLTLMKAIQEKRLVHEIRELPDAVQICKELKPEVALKTFVLEVAKSSQAPSACSYHNVVHQRAGSSFTTWLSKQAADVNVNILEAQKEVKSKLEVAMEALDIPLLESTRNKAQEETGGGVDDKGSSSDSKSHIGAVGKAVASKATAPVGSFWHKDKALRDHMKGLSEFLDYCVKSLGRWKLPGTTGGKSAPVRKGSGVVSSTTSTARRLKPQAPALARGQGPSSKGAEGAPGCDNHPEHFTVQEQLTIPGRFTVQGELQGSNSASSNMSNRAEGEMNTSTPAPADTRSTPSAAVVDRGAFLEVEPSSGEEVFQSSCTGEVCSAKSSCLEGPLSKEGSEKMPSSAEGGLRRRRPATSRKAVARQQKPQQRDRSDLPEVSLITND
ncbi:unnamed protein product [Amoebophrya sp. A25]|nr:unnamed protein product [Amoebophrya sp. A25]|eukprot:GSA25T00002877001.1